MMDQKIIIFCGADMTGKTEISRALSKKLNIPYFKASTEKNNFKKSPEFFINEMRYADPRMTDMLKQTRITAGNILLRDDWMSIREAEGGTAMPDNIKTYRAAIRTESGKKEDEINALSDLDAVKLYHATPYTYVYKVENVDGTYGPTTKSITWHINLVEHYEASDPLAEVDPAFVSLVKE